MLYNLISGSYNYVICFKSDDWYRVWMLTIILSITQLVIFQLLIHVCYHGVFMQLLLLELTLLPAFCANVSYHSCNIALFYYILFRNT